jgi:hypothetical protein
LDENEELYEMVPFSFYSLCLWTGIYTGFRFTVAEEKQDKDHANILCGKFYPFFGYQWPGRKRGYKKN